MKIEWSSPIHTENLVLKTLGGHTLKDVVTFDPDGMNALCFKRGEDGECILDERGAALIRGYVVREVLVRQEDGSLTDGNTDLEILRAASRLRGRVLNAYSLLQELVRWAGVRRSWGVPPEDLLRAIPGMEAVISLIYAARILISGPEVTEEDIVERFKTLESYGVPMRVIHEAIRRPGAPEGTCVVLVRFPEDATWSSIRETAGRLRSAARSHNIAFIFPNKMEEE